MTIRLGLIFTIVALTLNLCASDLKADIPPLDRITFPEAQKLALGLVSGKVTSGSLEHADGTWIYVFQIMDIKGKPHLVALDAKNGKPVNKMMQIQSKPAPESKGQ